MSEEGDRMPNFWMTGVVAKNLSISEDRVRQLERAGILKAIRTSTGVRLFDPADVRVLKQQRAERTGR